MARAPRVYRVEYGSRIERLTEAGFTYKAARGHGGHEVQIEGEKYSYRFEGDLSPSFVRQFERHPHSPPVPIPGTDRVIITVYEGWVPGKGGIVPGSTAWKEAGEGTRTNIRSYNLSNAQLRNLDRLAKGLDFDLKDTETP